ncbi:MAG: hypothetical protein ACOC1F_05830 [Myxococcota bacterium]
MIPPRWAHRLRALALLGAAPLASCNVEPPADSTGGTDLPAGTCGRGVVVVNTDYQSTNVSLVSWEGDVLSSSFLSSASGATGLSSPLGGDVTLPSQRQEDEIVLIDRYPASVLTWVDVSSGSPSGQLSVATGYPANPHDFAIVGPNKAYVTRYEANADPGREPFDQGDDVLIIDPAARTIAGRIDLAPAMRDAGEGFHAHPDKLLLAGDRVFVLLGAYAPDYLSSAPSRLVTLDTATDAITDVVILEGMHGCTAMALAPSGHELAVACSGEFAGDSVSTLAESGLVLVSTNGSLSEHRRFPAAKFEQGPLASAIAYTSDTRLLFTTAGQFAAGQQPERQDSLLILETETGSHELVLQSQDEPFSLGDVRCAPACHACYLADAARSGGVLHRLSLHEDGTLGPRTEVVVDRDVGLPPRNLGWF